ncbi:MAG TPA: DUF2062 domain-containing protein [Steroidobacteraceae bacterium]|nr:DUF2062 domain-containing protein [Steroidobacteraceae bacterium]
MRSASAVVARWSRRRIADPLLQLLRQGMSADRLALAVAVGLVVGNIPIFGTSTILCVIIALAFRLNQPAMQIAQAAMAPTQLLLIIPFVRLGEWLLRAPHQTISIKAALAFGPRDTERVALVLRDAMIHAGVAWMLVAPIGIYCIYRLLAPIFRRAAAEGFRNNQAEQP